MPESLRRDASVWLLLAIPALLPFGSAVELPILLAAGLGLRAVWRREVDLHAPAPRLALVLFAAYWGAETLSAFDAIAPRKSWTEVAADLRFAPLLLFACTSLHDARRVRLAQAGLAVLVALWCADALLQAATGISLGGAARGDRLSGIFGDDNLKLGGVIAAFAPIAIGVAWQRGDARAAVLALLLLGLVVLLAGARAAWVVFALACALLLWHRLGLRRGALALLLAAFVAVVAGAATYALSPRFAERMDRTAAALGGDPAAIDHALSGRLPIWKTAIAMGAAHPVNGVGVRGFRYAYPAYADADDPWLEGGTGALHAHQLLLELWAETGVIGLAFWLLGFGFALRSWRTAARDARALAVTPGIALVAVLFPLNTHYAVYSTFWSVLVFVLVAMWVGAMQLALRRNSIEVAE